MKSETALLLIIFNRPDLTLKLYEQLKALKPSKLYIISDGGRNDKECLIIEQSRMIFNNIEWKCKVKRNYSTNNMGLRKRIVSGIDWAFESEEKLIILEDDCIPHPDFIPFCEAMLEKYRDNKKIMTINGCNLNQSLTCKNRESHFFSRYANSWGWATWKEAWSRYDKDLDGLKNPTINKLLKSHLTAPIRATLYWRYKLNEVKSNRINSWAFRWMFTLFENKALAIVPRTNLITNIGNDERSTNTKGKLHYINLPTSSINKLESIDPENTTPNNTYDKWVEDSIYSKSLTYRLNWIIQKILDN
jgi:hypothetical protein